MKIGKVSYLNTIPLFYSWEGDFELIEGHPRELTIALREGRIQGGIVSSVEYLINKDRYKLIGDFCIASRERACSVIICSDKQIETIKTLSLSEHSLSSNLLAIYLLKGVEVLKPGKSADARVIIGDEAFKAIGGCRYFYDLVSLWRSKTGLGFVFALFMVRKDVDNKEIKKLELNIHNSLERFFSSIPKHLEAKRDYFTRCLHYRLTEEDFMSLKVFEDILSSQLYNFQKEVLE
ncbi:MAG: MqnA/MqnD/SBP family protein [Aquificaceae bacterium]